MNKIENNLSKLNYKKKRRKIYLLKLFEDFGQLSENCLKNEHNLIISEY